MSRRLLGAFVVMMGLFMGMERYLKPAAAVEVDVLIVNCNETWFGGQMQTDADEIRVMVSRASDGFVLVSQTFPAVQKQYANRISYPAQPEGTVLTLSFGEWEFAYLQTPLVTDSACDNSQENRINQPFATVTRGPTLTPSKTHTPAAPDLTATHYYWLVVTHGPGILTQLPPLPTQLPSRTPTPYQTKQPPSRTPLPNQIIVFPSQTPVSNQMPVFPSRTPMPIATVTSSPTLMPAKTQMPSAQPGPDLTATHYYWLVVTHGPGILTQLPPLPAQP